MSYTNIKPTEPLRQKVYYKLVFRNDDGSFCGVFTRTILPVGCWIKAINVRESMDRWHSCIRGFKGFGVFSRESVALKYLKSHKYRIIHRRLKVVRVVCGGSVKKAFIEAKESRLTCYIFDKIKIID